MKKNTDILLELKDIAPALSTVIAHSPYAIEAGYFNAFSEQILHKISAAEVAEELSQIAPVIAQVAKTEAYSVPVQYFSTFPLAITQLAVYENKEHPATVYKWTTAWEALADRLFGALVKPQYTFAMASVVSVALIFGMVWTNKANTTDEKFFAKMEQLPDHEIHGYVARHHDEFEEHIILHHINDTEFVHAIDNTDEQSDDIID